MERGKCRTSSSCRRGGKNQLLYFQETSQWGYSASGRWRLMATRAEDTSDTTRFTAHKGWWHRRDGRDEGGCKRRRRIKNTGKTGSKRPREATRDKPNQPKWRYSCLISGSASQETWPILLHLSRILLFALSSLLFIAIRSRYNSMSTEEQTGESTGETGRGDISWDVSLP